jgi:3-dehydroquinate synthase II
MKFVWIKADRGTWEERKARITSALELGTDAVLVNEEDVRKVRELGRIKIAAFFRDGKSDADVLVVGKGGEGDGTNPLPVDFRSSADFATLRSLARESAAYVEIKSKKHERFVVDAAKFAKYVIVIGTDWKVIPLENIIAELGSTQAGTKIIAGAGDYAEAKVALETLEHGADGVLLDSGDRLEMRQTISIAKGELRPLALKTAKVTKVKPVGMGDRVCVDTCSVLTKGEGMLVGSQSSGFFLVHAEVEESPYVAARPFRVNAGAVHAYVLTGEKTKYLSELEAGDEVLVVNAGGEAHKAVVGRVKIERRPLMLVEADAGGEKIKTFLQNAETIKLVSKDGTPVSVTSLKEGDEILVHISEGGRHFGTKVEETIIEK